MNKQWLVQRLPTSALPINCSRNEQQRAILSRTLSGKSVTSFDYENWDRSIVPAIFQILCSKREFDWRICSSLQMCYKLANNEISVNIQSILMEKPYKLFFFHLTIHPVKKIKKYRHNLFQSITELASTKKFPSAANFVIEN